MSRIPNAGDILPAKEAIEMIPWVDLSSPIAIPEISPEAYRANIPEFERKFYLDEIVRLAKEKNALILAHNYMPDIVQDAAHFVSDSIKLAQAGRDSTADILVEASVLFMNQILAVMKKPHQKVLAPSLDALCSLAAHAKADTVRAWKAEHPDGVVISYVNTYLDVKAESDYCCGSANAEKVIRYVLAHHPKVSLLFLPDVYLGLFATTVLADAGEPTDRIYLMMGACHVHDMIRPWHLDDAREAHPDAAVVYHPECGCTSACITEVREGRVTKEKMQPRSTQGMIEFVRNAPESTIIMATERDNAYPIMKAVPGKTVIPANPKAVCAFMKQNTLRLLYEALRDEKHVIEVDPDLARRAREPIERMLAIV
jgi:quinolinate synthase